MNYLFYSKNNFVLGERLRRVIKGIDCEMYYFNNLTQAINFLTTCENGVMFIEKCFSKYIKFIAQLVDCDVFKNYAIVFIDDEADKNFVNNKNIFNISEVFTEADVLDVVNKFNYVIENEWAVDFGQLKVMLSKILMDIGLSLRHIGFSYIKDCIEYISKRHFKLGGLHGDVYKHVALINNTNESNVERSIRNCIIQARKNNQNFLPELHNSSNITNKSFLRYVIEKLHENSIKV